ncbi:IIGP1-like protein, partial [Mya arenaria]
TGLQTTQNDAEFKFFLRTDWIARHLNKRSDQLSEQDLLHGLEDKFHSFLNLWKNKVVDIAIVGESGAGKSAFINALMGLTSDDRGAAAVGCYSKFRETNAHHLPWNVRISCWELPGIGLPSFSKDTFNLEENMRRYDLFILITSYRLRENDIWLARKVQGYNTPLYFVRTKIDIDITADKRAHPKTHDAVHLISEIRKETKQHLQRNGIYLDEQFMIDSNETMKYDFGRLKRSLNNKAIVLKRQKLLCT